MLTMPILDFLCYIHTTILSSFEPHITTQLLLYWFFLLPLFVSEVKVEAFVVLPLCVCVCVSVKFDGCEETCFIKATVTKGKGPF